MRKLVIGDVHGGLKSLVQALERALYNPEKDMLIFLGDYVDGWSESAELIEYLIELDSKAKYKSIFLLGNHDCVDEHTELFTNNGWKKYGDILKSDSVIGMNHLGQSEWQFINKIIIKNSNHINYYKTNRIDMAVTDNHRVLHINGDKLNYTYTKDIKYSDRLNLPLASNSLNNISGFNLTDNELKIAAWIYTDGHIDKNKSITIYQSKIENVNYIKNLLTEYGLTFKDTIRQRENIIIKNVKVKNILLSHDIRLYKSSSNRLINKFIDVNVNLPGWLNLLTHSKLKIFLKEVLRADGSSYKDGNNHILYGTKKFLSDIQPYFTLIGYSCNMKMDNRGDYRLNISNNITTTIRQDVSTINRVIGDYKVWCLSVRLGNFLVRRNGKIHFTGNCWCKDWLNNGQTPMIWTQQGGQATIDSYIKTGYLTKDSHREFFNNCLNYYIDDENRGFCHGGFTSRKGLGHDPYEANYYWDRDLWNVALMSDGKYHEGPEQYRRFEKHKEIYIGHTSTINWNNKPHYKEYDGTNRPITIPMNRCNVWNMDTGGGFGGKVTVMDIDTKEYFQSDYVKELYPNELGR